LRDDDAATDRLWHWPVIALVRCIGGFGPAFSFLVAYVIKPARAGALPVQ
jgi:hypothetical protein